MNISYNHLKKGIKTPINRMLLLLVLLASIFHSTELNAQITLNTTAVPGFSNNNGSGTVTFNFQNTNAFAVIITDVEGIVGTAGLTSAAIWIKTTPVNGSPGAISVANGWNQVAVGTFTGVANFSTLVTQPMLTGLSVVIPAGVTYGMAVTAYSGISGRQRYHSMAFPNVPLTTVSGGGCNILMGTNISYAGNVPPTAPTFTPRGWIGKLTFVPAIACSGMPNAGVITAPPAVCSSTNFTITTTGMTVGTGVTYQWQSAASCAGPWTNIAGATSSNLTTSLSVATSYQLVTNCTLSGLTNTSNCVTVALNPFLNCYCTSSATSTFDEDIGNVTVGGINNTSSCGVTAPGPGSSASLYSNFKTSVAPGNLNMGATTPYSVSILQCNFGPYTNQFRIYIDYNQNGLFTDPGENVATNNGAGAWTGTGTFLVPLTATAGTTVMRVIDVEGSVSGPCGTYTWGETEDYLVNLIAANNCSGAPSPGNTTATTNPACVGVNFTLSMSSIPSSTGNTYIWQSSPDGITWTTIPLATGVSYITSQTVATWYQAVVTCTFSGQSTTSTPILVTNQLCYCASNATQTFDEEIFNVTVGTLNNTSSCATLAPGPGSLQNRYSNYRGFAPVPNFTQALSYPVSITVGECGTFAFSGSSAVFIDFNQNGVFDATEKVYNSAYGPQQPAGTISTGNIFIPNCALPGLTTMRVVYREGSTAPPACGTFSYGEVEDYNVNIVAAPIVPPVATSISGTSTAVCNTSLSYTVAPGYFNILQWQFATVSGGPYTDIANATNANQTLFANGPATFYLRVRFIGGGCVADAYSNEIITVITSPVVTFTTSTPSASICRGTPITITATTAGPYAWNTGANTQSITQTPLVNTTYTVATGSGLCTGAGAILVDIIGGPIAVASVAPNTAQCPGASVNLNANQILGVPGTGYTGAAIPYTTVSNAGTPTAAGDDVVSGALPIGFNFTFFGVAYTQAYVGSNGFITFTAGSPSGCCAGQNLPSAATPNNLIALAWNDLNNTGNSITYNTLGSAPNRQFVVSYTNVAHFGGGGTPLTGQIILNETTNTVEVHISSITGDGSNQTQGMENAAGNSAITTPGRNATNWSASSSGYMYTPNLGQTFTYSGAVTYSWVGSNGFTSTSNNTVDYPEVPTTYTLTIADDICSSSSATTALVHPAPAVESFTGSPFCENSSVDFFTDGSGYTAPAVAGSLNVHVFSSGWMDESSWQIRNNANVVIASGGPYGFGANINVTVTPLATAYPVTFTIETQGVIGDNTASYDVTCNATSTILTSGSLSPGLTFTSAPYSCSGGGNGSLQYSWTGPNGFTSTAEDPYIASAQLPDNGDYTVVITDGHGCTESFTTNVVVNDNPEPYQSSMNQVSCNGFSDGSFQVDVNGGTPFFSFYESNLNQQNFDGYYSGLFDGSYYIQVTDINGCVNASPLEVIVTTVPNIAPVIICPAPVTISNDGGVCGATVNYATPVGTDVCPVIGTVQTAGLASGSLFPIGTIVNTYEVTDVLGLTATCSFSVTVSDNEFPLITSSLPDTIYSCNPISWAQPVVTDNCLGVQTTSTHQPNTNFPAGTTMVTYTATDVYNNVTNYSFYVTRYEESVKSTSITSSRDFNNICQGESITLTINGGSLGEGATWKWYTGTCGGTALPAFNGMTSITVTPSLTTKYFARAEGVCNITACDSINVVVSTTAPNGVSITSVPAIGAVGQTGVVTCTNVPGATFYRWTSNLGHINSIWFNGGPGPVETPINSVNIAFQIAQQNYQIRVVAGNACGRSNNASAHIRGTVPAPTCLVGPVIACQNSSATYSVATCPIAGTNGYQWTVTGATITAGQGTATITVAFGAGFNNATVCVSGVSTFGLAGPTTCLNVTSNALTPTSITGNNTPCQNSLESYISSVVPGATSYQWSTNIVGATASGTTTTGSIQFPSNAFSGQVCVQAVSGCGTSAAYCFNVTSGVAGTPGAISGPLTGLCEAENINYSLATNDANSYSWVLPAGVSFSNPMGSNNANSVNVNFGAGLTAPMTISVWAIYDCDSAMSSIVVSGQPGAPTVTPNVFCAGATEFPFASSTGINVSYNWTFTGVVDTICLNAPVCSDYYVQWTPAGGTVSITATNTCGTSPAFNGATVNCVRMVGNIDTRVYPNPTDGNLTIEFNSFAGGNYNLSITDMAGRTVVSEDVKATSGKNEHLVDLGFANAGMYMLYLRDANGDISVHKITKE